MGTSLSSCQHQTHSLLRRDASHVKINKHDILNRKMSHSYYPTKINLENTNYNNLGLILTDSPLFLWLSEYVCMYSEVCVCVCVCVCVSVTFFSCCCLNRQSLRYSLQNCAHAILISHQNMEAGAPTPSLTPYIIDYARLQISLEKKKKKKERKTKQDRERVRDNMETKGGSRERDRQREWVLKRSCHLCTTADSEPSPYVSLSWQQS